VNIRSLGAVVAAFGVISAAPASAAVMVATYSGVLTSGFDMTGEFGPPNSDLTGDAFVATYTYDPEAAAMHFTGPGFDMIYGGAIYGTPVPLSDASITVNGVTHHINPITNYGEADAISYLFFDQALGSTISSSVYDASYISDAGPASNAPTSLDQRYRNAFNDAGTIYGNYFAISIMYNFSLQHYAYGTAAFGKIYYSVVKVGASAVPEPATWAVLLAGFCGLGAMMRRWRGSPRGATPEPDAQAL
jgi:hypothetical protein